MKNHQHKVLTVLLWKKKHIKYISSLIYRYTYYTILKPKSNDEGKNAMSSFFEFIPNAENSSCIQSK